MHAAEYSSTKAPHRSVHATASRILSLVVYILPSKALRYILLYRMHHCMSIYMLSSLCQKRVVKGLSKALHGACCQKNVNIIVLDSV